MQRQHEPLLLPFSFPFPQVTLRADSGEVTECTFLSACGIHRTGLWRRECPCFAGTPLGALTQVGERAGRLAESLTDRLAA